MGLNLSVILSAFVILGLAFVFETSFAAGKKHYGKHLCKDSRYYCIKVNRGDTWSSLFSNKKQRDIVMRMNRTNIALHYRKWIVVPYNLSDLSVMDVTPLPKKIKYRGSKLVLIDLKKMAFAAYNPYGKQVYWGPISGGKGWCTDVGQSCHTVIGRFKMDRKKAADCISKKFPLPSGGAKMAYCMFFHGGYAMHAGQLPGFNDSHGCVRMFYEDSKWLNLNFVDVGVGGTEVIVIR